MPKNGPPAAALKKFEESFAKIFGDAVPLKRDFKYDVIPTGSVELDVALGVGGYIKGRLVEIWGPEGTAKTTSAMIAVAQAQKTDPDKLQGWIDMEQTYDPAWARAHGVDTSKVLVAQPNSAEDVADIAKTLLDSGLINMLVVDSVGGMVGKAEFEKDADEATVALIAKIVTRMVKIAAVIARQQEVAVLIINQVRANISGNGRGPATTRGGGFALGHVTTHRIKARKTATPPYTVGTAAKGNVEQVGQEIAFVVEKNKVAPPGRTATLTMFNQRTAQYGEVGIDRAFEAFGFAKRLNLFEAVSGAHYTLADGTKHLGKDPTIAHLRTRPDLVDGIRVKALAAIAHEVVQDESEEG
jgi:recombination protein RecA